MSLIESLFTQEARIELFAGLEDAAPVYRETPPRKCRLEVYNRMEKVGVQGGIRVNGRVDNIGANALMFCTGAPIPARSIVTVDGESYTVTECAEARGFGLDHLEVKLV